MPRKPPDGKATKPRRDDLPTVGVSALRANHTITLDMKSVTVAFGEIKRDVRVSHTLFPNGGSWSYFVCSCGRRVRTIRLYDGRIVCRSCDGLLARCQSGDDKGHGDKAPVIERLRQKLYGPTKIANRSRVEAALKRALIVQRRLRLGQ